MPPGGAYRGRGRSARGGVRVRPSARRRAGRRGGRAREQAGHPRPAREAGWAEPWAARPRPAVAMEPGRGRGPGRSAGAGLVARGSAEAAGEAASLAHRRLRLRGCSVSRGRARGKPLECPGTFVCPPCGLGRAPKGRPGAIWPPWFCPLLHPPCHWGRPRGEVFFVCWWCLVPFRTGRPHACWVLCLQ